MRVLIAGASGLLGRAVTQQLADHDVVATALSREREGYVRLDARDADAVRRLTRQIRPDAVVNLVAERRVEFWDQEDVLTERNVSTAVHLAEASDAIGARFVHASTDYVFDGSASPYRVTATHSPLNNYGRTKSLAEAAVRKANPAGVIVRMPVLYGEVERLDECNLSDLVPTVMNGRTQVLDDWAQRRPTLAADVAGTIRELVCSGRPYESVQHVTGPDVLTKYEMALAIAARAGADAGHLTPDRRPSVSRPRDTTLECGGPGRAGVGGYRGFAEGLDAVLPGYLALWRKAQAS